MPKPSTALPTTAAKPSGLVRADGRPVDVVAFEEALVGFFVEAADLLGAPKSVAAIYAICFASPEPLGFSEINERLEISSGSISQGLRVLREIGALKIVDPSSGRPVDQSNGAEYQSNGSPEVRSSGRQALARQRERYEPDLALRKLVLRFIAQRLETQLKSGHDRLDRIAATIPPSLQSEAKKLKDRLDALQTWHAQARAVLPLVKTFLKLT
jgi:HTH-type transcriptional regulator, glycine betaine synthesis regulator